MVDTTATLGGMETKVLEYPSTMITSPTGDITVPVSLRRYRPTVARPSEIKSLRRLPELTVVWTKAIETLLSHGTFLRAGCNDARRSWPPAT